MIALWQYHRTIMKLVENCHGTGRIPERYCEKIHILLESHILVIPEGLVSDDIQ
ncbi:hypothetical protein C1645_840892 [Glomus cerebriforme]|uniref:Uncharacterized protein n=1 Tax=Glomus cerebriforme TaxID=658196 RepID=A0A397RYN4_9GLOM|nr:hypothetical protein C1645_840892 [Glomus cerebriforme]